jgi:HicB family
MSHCPENGDRPNPPASGRIVVRMPATLHNELRRMAIEENVSINHLICASLAGAMRWRAPDLDMRALSQEARERMIWEGWAKMFR